MRSTIISSLAKGFIFVVIIFFMVSCRAGLVNYYGLIVPETRQIRLKTGQVYKGSWQTEDVTVIYEYIRHSDQLNISGHIDFSDKIKNFRQLDRFHLWIHFIDTENKITGQNSLAPYAYYFEIEKINFNKRISLPPQTMAIIFSYSGFASEGIIRRASDPDNGIYWRFWKTPHG